jgi:hypothetical protein
MRIHSNKGKRSLKTSLQTEEQLQKAKIAFQNKEHPPIQAAATHYHVDRKSLSRRLHDGVSRMESHKHQQVLTNIEELTLVHWIKRYKL